MVAEPKMANTMGSATNNYPKVMVAEPGNVENLGFCNHEMAERETIEKSWVLQPNGFGFVILPGARGK